VIAIEAHLEPEGDATIAPDVTWRSCARSPAAEKVRASHRCGGQAGGWKFATLTEDLNEPEEIQFIVKRLSEKLTRPYEIEGKPYAVQFEFMPVVHSLQHHNPIDILNAAHQAMSARRGKQREGVLRGKKFNTKYTNFMA